MKHTPLKDLCYLGGWKEPQTVLKCYQRPDESTMREALEGRKPLKALGGVAIDTANDTPSPFWPMKKPRPVENHQAGQAVEKMGLGRVELPTSRLSGVRSNHLSYRPGGVLG